MKKITLFTYLFLVFLLGSVFVSSISASDKFYYDEFGLIREAEGIVLSSEYIETDDRLSVPACILISLGIGLAAAIITVLILRGQLKSVKSAKNASVYVENCSFRLTESRDIFLYSTVTKTPKSQNKSSKSR